MACFNSLFFMVFGRLPSCLGTTQSKIADGIQPPKGVEPARITTAGKLVRPYGMAWLKTPMSRAEAELLSS